jgi:hypothetical protein
MIWALKFDRREGGGIKRGGDHNMMKIGGHFEDSEDDDDVYMSDGSYDKSYKPPGMTNPTNLQV